jgi:hypothetical protein
LGGALFGCGGSCGDDTAENPFDMVVFAVLVALVGGFMIGKRLRIFGDDTGWVGIGNGVG